MKTLEIGIFRQIKGHNSRIERSWKLNLVCLLVVFDLLYKFQMIYLSYWLKPNVGWVDICTDTVKTECISPWNLSSGDIKTVQLGEMGRQIKYYLERYTFLTFETDQFLFLAMWDFLILQDKKNHVRFTGKCMLYSLCQLPPRILHAFPF
jgi:hypothetical protein